MNRMMKSVLGLLCAAGLFAAPAARADIAPPDFCHAEKVACHNAGANYDEDGVCTATTCSRGAPGQVTTYECLKCEPGAVPGAAGASTVTETDDHKDDGSGCSVRALGSEKGVATLMLGLGLLALGISRRSR